MESLQLAYSTIQAYVHNYVQGPAGRDFPAVKKLALQLGISSAVVYYFYRIVVYRLYLDPINRLPGPKVGWLPFMGNFPEIMKEDAGVPLKRWAKKFGGIFVFHGAWNEPRILVTDDRLVKQILMTQEYDFTKTPVASRFLRRIIGNGLLVAEGATHRHQRKMLNPAFSVNSVRALVPLMAKPGYRLRNTWIKQMTDEENAKVKTEDGQELSEVEVSSGLSLATLDVIGWAFGQDLKSLEFAGTPHQSKLSQAYLGIFSVDASFFRTLTFIFPILRHLPTERNRKRKRDRKWLNEESEALVRAGIARAAQAKDSEIKKNEPKDLLATIVDLVDEETGKGFTVDELKEQCLTFLAAG